MELLNPSLKTVFPCTSHFDKHRKHFDSRTVYNLFNLNNTILKCTLIIGIIRCTYTLFFGGFEREITKTNFCLGIPFQAMVLENCTGLQFFNISLVELLPLSTSVLLKYRHMEQLGYNHICQISATETQLLSSEQGCFYNTSIDLCRPQSDE